MKTIWLFSVLLFVAVNFIVFKKASCCAKKLPQKCQRPYTYTTFGSSAPDRFCKNREVPPSSLRFEKGDVIRCLMGYIAGFHFMLATSSINVIHIAGVQNKKDAKISEDTFMSATSHYPSCEVYTDCMDCDMLESDQNARPYSSDLAVTSARNMKSEKAEVYYNLLYCNCEHWVAYWRYGKALSGQGAVGGWRSGKTESNCRI